MVMSLERLKGLVEKAEAAAICQIDKPHNQIYVRFSNKQDTEIALLVPLQQRAIAKGYLEDEDLSDLLFSIRRIANA